MNTITITSGRKKVELGIRTILYIQMHDNFAEIHTSDGKIYKSLITLEKLENAMGDRFLRVHRSRMVSVMAIRNITDMVNLNNGEQLGYVSRRKNSLIAEMNEKRTRLIESLGVETPIMTDDELRNRHHSFDTLPIAFADLERVPDKGRSAADWVFRYANPALAKLARMPLNELVGRSFKSVFPDMDGTWRRGCERAVLRGETIELMEYSPEINTYLKMICFPTTHGHCGCLMFDIAAMKFAENRGDAESAKLRYVAKMLSQLM